MGIVFLTPGAPAAPRWMRRCAALALLLLGSAAVSRGQEAPLASALQASYKAEAEGDYQAAIQPLTALGPGGSAAYIVHVRLGWLYYGAKDWPQSIEHYRNAAKLAPFAIEPLLGLLLPQQAAGRNDDAIATAQVVLRQDPNNYTAISHTAWLLYLRRDYRQAAIMYRKLVDLYPTDTEMLLGLGYALKLAGDRKESAQYFNTVLLLSPNNARALDGLRDDEGGRGSAAPDPAAPATTPTAQPASAGDRK